MRVFVLGTGRCGSVTFARACAHATNYTVGHESKAHLVGPERVEFPDRHIEVDNRLSWFTGALADMDDAFFVHLVRSPEAVATSFVRRWDSPYRPSIIRAFGHGIVMRRDDWSEADKLRVCRTYVETVTRNIEVFLEGRPSITVQLEQAAEGFAHVWGHIGAAGDRDAALAEFHVRHNAS